MRIIDLFKSRENNSLYHYLFKSSMITLLVQGLAVLLLFGVNYFIEDKFGTTTLGVYSKVVFWVNLLATISLFGFDDIVNKFWFNSSKSGGKKSLLIYAFKGVFVASVVISFVFFTIANLYSFSGLSSFDSLYYSFIWVVPITAILMLFQVVLKAEKQILLSLIGENILKPVLFLLAMLFVTSLVGVINVYSLSILITSLVIFLASVIYFKKKSDLNNAEEKNNVKKEWVSLLKFFIFLQITTSAFDKLDYISVSLNLSDEMMAYFSIISKIVVLLSLPITIVNSINAPLYHKFVSERNLKGLETYFRKSTQGVFVVTLFSALILSFIGYHVLNYFGPDYVNYFPLLLLLIIDRVIRSLFGSIVYLLTMIGQERLVSIVVIVFLVIGFLFVWLSTLKYGIYGAALAYSIIRILYLLSLFLLAKNKLKLKFWIFN